MRKFLLSFLTLVIVAGAALYLIFPPIAAKHPALQGDLPEIVPLRALYAEADARWRYRISPDGRYLAWLEAKNLKPALWVRPLGGEETEIFHTDDVVRWYAWSADSRYLLYQADRDGWENDVIVSIDVTRPGSAPRTYDFGKGVKSWIHTIPQDGGNTILIGHNGRDRARFDLYTLNLDTGETVAKELVSELGVHWSVDRKGDIYARHVTVTPDNWHVELRDGEGWRRVASGGLEDNFRIIAEPQADGRFLAVSDLGRDKLALVRIDPVSGAEEVLFEDDVVDLSGVELDHRDGRLLSVVFYPGYQQRHFFDEAYKAIMDRIPRDDGPSALHRVSATKDLTKMILEVEHGSKGWFKYLVDTKTDQVTLFQSPTLEAYAAHLTAMEPVTFPAQDDLTLHATLTRPKGVQGPGPTVIIIHGGPVARSAWRFSGLHAWLSNRGYAVLDVNYRASAGFGRAFREAAIGEVSRKMHQDIVDARAWAVDQGIADPDKVAVLGGSFGGLKVLTALTQTPDLFAAGIDINGISDISTMLQEVPVYWRGWPHWYRKYIGDPDDPEQLAEIKHRSPLYHADKITAPLMIIQGTNDVRVIQDQADRMVQAMRAANKPVEYHLLDGAGHQFRNWGWKTRLIAHRRMERFLAEHLGGRADGFDYAVLGAYVLP